MIEINTKYKIIIETICNMNGIEKEKLLDILKNKECKYLLYLLLNKYNCCGEVEDLNRDLKINNKRVVRFGVKKAKEKFLINRYFRDKYFEMDKLVEKKLKNNI